MYKFHLPLMASDSVSTHSAESGNCSTSSTEHSLKECPIFFTLSLIANKWSVRILYFLLHAPQRTLRFNQLQKQLGGITQRELTKHLREFEKSGIVDRTVFPQVPPRVEYTLTDLGCSLWKPIEDLSSWAEENGELIRHKRAAFEARSSTST
jgi:DNA-binding HxlR family transcriptional regulator